MNLLHRAFDLELEGFFLDYAGALAKRAFVDLNGARGRMEETGGGKFG